MTRLPLALSLALSLAALAAPARAQPVPSLLDRAVVLEATRLAIERAGLAAGASSSLASRARNAAWLPNVSVRVARNTGAATTQYALASGDRQLLDDSLYVDVRVSLALDRLVFDPHEVALWRDEQRRAERRARLEADVLDALARLEHLRLQRAAQPPDAPPDVAWRYEHLRARARVELMTGVPVEALLAAPTR
ncbi:MAG: hypothetical protein U0324_41275 [Polyangiales bacterium]